MGVLQCGSKERPYEVVLSLRELRKENVEIEEKCKNLLQVILTVTFLKVSTYSYVISITSEDYASRLFS